MMFWLFSLNTTFEKVRTIEIWALQFTQITIYEDRERSVFVFGKLFNQTSELISNELFGLIQTPEIKRETNQIYVDCRTFLLQNLIATSSKAITSVELFL